MRTPIARLFLVAAALVAVHPDAHAQKRRRGGADAAPAAAPSTPAADPGAEGGKKKKKKRQEPVVAVEAGQLTELGAQAKRLFNDGKYAEAAVLLDRVSKGEAGDTQENRDEARFNLAKALYYVKLYQHSYAIFSEIAEARQHPKYQETLLWLAKLATDLPEPADIVERVGKYDDAAIERFNNADQQDLYWELNYLMGRYKYRNRLFDEALQLFAKVDRRSKYYVQSQFFSGISFVQQRKSVPAVQAFQRIVGAVEEGQGGDDGTRLKDLAYLSMARTYYSASVRVDDVTNAPTVDSSKLSAAVKYWNLVDDDSEYWLDALFEESWAYYMAGDYSHALGNVHTIEAPYFPKSYYPEGQVLKAVIYFSNCQFDDAQAISAKIQAKYKPIYDELAALVAKYPEGTDDALVKLLVDVRAGSAKVPSHVKPVVELALGDRQLLRFLEYVKMLDDETARLGEMPAELRKSGLGSDIKDNVELARTLAVQGATKLARERFQRNLDELAEQLRNTDKIVIDVLAAQRNQLEQALVDAQVSETESQRNIVVADAEHVVWPFKGEYWRDELGFYRQTITSKCGR
jgi:tetratricopeptide (TPR) repeat protein